MSPADKAKLKRNALRALNTAPGSDYPHPIIILGAEQIKMIRDALDLITDEEG